MVDSPWGTTEPTTVMRHLSFCICVLAATMSGSAEGWASPGDDVRLSATWGQTVSSQLVDEAPIAIWNVAIEAPLVQRLGLVTQLRFDSIVFGEPGNALSLMIHPGRTDYNLALRLLPPGSSFGLELHHVSSHEVEPLHDGSRAKFENTVDVGGASNFVSALWMSRWVEARLGAGSSWSDTNTAPMLLGIEGVLLNTRIASGPFATVAVPYRWGRAVGRAGFVAIHDADRQREDEGDYLAWGSSLRMPLVDHLALGASWVGNNGIPGRKRADNILSVFLQLRWLDGQPQDR